METIARRVSISLFVASMAATQGACTKQAPSTASTNDPPQVITIDLTAATPASLPTCTAALAGATAFVASPSSLWTCQSGNWVPQPCTAALAGAVAYSSVPQTLVACTEGKWAQVALPPGPQGPMGAEGKVGPAGPPGTLLAISKEPAGPNCPAGGERVDVGTDANGNGVLDGAEIQKTAYVCNGPMGATGDPGPMGQPGTPGAASLVTSAPEAPGANCVAGGVAIETGVDVNRNGVLDASEISGTSYVCNGVNGTNGADGSPGQPGAPGKDGVPSLVVSAAEPPGMNCVNGGVRIDSGPDTNGDGTLDATERTGTSYVCNGGAQTRVARFDDPTCDPSVAPDAEHAVFADVISGDDVFGTGEASSPVQTLSKAVSLAVALGKTSLYLAEGMYAGALTLPPGSALYVEGGWRHGGLGSWQRDCDATARQTTVLMGVVANGVAGGLRSLTVHAQGGLSNIAVRVATGTFKVRECALEAGDAASGSVGTNGASGGLLGTNSCGNGARGTPASAGVGSAGGTFDATGAFTPGNGTSGSFGGSGQPGTAGATASCALGRCDAQYNYVTGPQCGTYQCNFRSCNPHDCNPYSCSCGFLCYTTCYETCYDTCSDTCYSSCNVFSQCSFTNQGSYSATGSCGAPGSGGGRGGGGGGGGASVALVIANGTSADVTGSSLSAGNGGNGAPGGAGGPGGGGAQGQVATCSDYVCGAPTTCGTVSTTKTAAAGGKGGDGANGSAGGAGAGGPSYGVVKVGTGALTIDAASTVAVGVGGTGAPGAADGVAAAIWP